MPKEGGKVGHGPPPPIFGRSDNPISTPDFCKVQSLWRLTWHAINSIENRTRIMESSKRVGVKKIDLNCVVSQFGQYCGTQTFLIKIQIRMSEESKKKILLLNMLFKIQFFNVYIRILFWFFNSILKEVEFSSFLKIWIPSYIFFCIKVWSEIESRPDRKEGWFWFWILFFLIIISNFQYLLCFL